MFEKQKCSECRHGIIKAPDMGGNHARGCWINHMTWREHDYRDRECFLPEPFCYAPAMVMEIEKLKSQLAAMPTGPRRTDEPPKDGAKIKEVE